MFVRRTVMSDRSLGEALLVTARGWQRLPEVQRVQGAPAGAP